MTTTPYDTVTTITNCSRHEQLVGWKRHNDDDDGDSEEENDGNDDSDGHGARDAEPLVCFI